ncbi:TM2 domain-containing membrane protein YozV [Alteribacillus persepolensis]|uniref:TM2 domain-containing membrane protein YozV n=1 Tax=Alteribacillus persepolensis TaxID=568899 RepID=A0A1G8AY95_9BACI|nr:hypothetical protein [Alteribacillus persepolensis]SDH25786.1 TM2 domain-containing membrane protein YozV [Alteribacillus persepolensis]
MHPKRHPGVAAVLSALWSGLGQIYNGQIGKGMALTIIQLLNYLLLSVLIGFITFPLVWIYGVVDAYRYAEKANRRHGD